MKLYPKGMLPKRDVKKFIVIFYIVGVLGFLIPFTQGLFIMITPSALLLNVYLLVVYRKDSSCKAIMVFLAIYLLGYFVELAGVATKLIFGDYAYGCGLSCLALR